MYSFLHSGQENPSFPVQNIKKVAFDTCSSLAALIETHSYTEHPIL